MSIQGKPLYPVHLPSETALSDDPLLCSYGLSKYHVYYVGGHTRGHIHVQRKHITRLMVQLEVEDKNNFTLFLACGVWKGHGKCEGMWAYWQTDAQKFVIYSPGMQEEELHARLDEDFPKMGRWLSPLNAQSRSSTTKLKRVTNPKPKPKPRSKPRPKANQTATSKSQQMEPGSSMVDAETHSQRWSDDNTKKILGKAASKSGVTFFRKGGNGVATLDDPLVETIAGSNIAEVILFKRSGKGELSVRRNHLVILRRYHIKYLKYIDEYTDKSDVQYLNSGNVHYVRNEDKRMVMVLDPSANWETSIESLNQPNITALQKRVTRALDSLRDERKPLPDLAGRDDWGTRQVGPRTRTISPNPSPSSSTQAAVSSQSRGIGSRGSSPNRGSAVADVRGRSRRTSSPSGKQHFIGWPPPNTAPTLRSGTAAHVRPTAHYAYESVPHDSQPTPISRRTPPFAGSRASLPRRTSLEDRAFKPTASREKAHMSSVYKPNWFGDTYTLE